MLERNTDYTRAEIAEAITGEPMNPQIWNQGYVDTGHAIVLLVTLEKTGFDPKHRYEDVLRTSEGVVTGISWVSQNRHSQTSRAGQRMSTHAELGVPVHLCVRRTKKVKGGKAAPFTYYGRVQFMSWAGNQPITVEWRLEQ